ncbi:MAG: hypothetical protein JXR89_02110 [Deltaproteobacteria bacterium]|nr:hypothetical protein [Deltaproteobacteria bacterium]
MQMKARIVFPLSLLLLVLGLGAGVGTYGLSLVTSGCLQCHEEDFDADLEAGLVIHRPCQEKRCLVCHCSEKARPVEAEAAAAKIEGPAVALPRATGAAEIEVIDLHLHESRFHSFLFAELAGPGPLLLEIWRGKERRGVEKIALPPLAGLPRLVDDRQPPRLSNVRVVRIESGALAAAVVCWQTDKPASSEVDYGIDDFGRRSLPRNELLYRHRVELNGLKPQRLYRLRGVSNDYFGNQGFSETITFSTAADFDEDLPAASDCRLLGHEFVNAAGRYLGIFEISTPVSLSLGLEEVPLSAADPAAAGGLAAVDATAAGEEAGAAAGDLHKFLLSPEDTNINNCFSCHKDIRREMSHPVNVRPNPRMKVPPEYPLLADGRLTCMSCHVRHAGRHAFRLIRAQGREFCQGCHDTY